MMGRIAMARAEGFSWQVHGGLRMEARVSFGVGDRGEGGL